MLAAERQVLFSLLNAWNPRCGETDTLDKRSSILGSQGRKQRRFLQFGPCCDAQRQRPGCFMSDIPSSVGRPFGVMVLAQVLRAALSCLLRGRDAAAKPFFKCRCLFDDTSFRCGGIKPSPATSLIKWLAELKGGGLEERTQPAACVP